MSTAVDYKNLDKKIMFSDNGHRHAKLVIRLKTDGLTQAKFFRHIVTGYIEGDERIISYVDDFKPQSKERKKKSQKLRISGDQKLRDFALSDGEVENIFDILEQEFPEL
tara:strand:+ start:403 stop:729 length:327 start_codon:yes stop_codon:yes gene_type:complete